LIKKREEKKKEREKKQEMHASAKSTNTKQVGTQVRLNPETVQVRHAEKEQLGAGTLTGNTKRWSPLPVPLDQQGQPYLAADSFNSPYWSVIGLALVPDRRRFKAVWLGCAAWQVRKRQGIAPLLLLLAHLPFSGTVCSYLAGTVVGIRCSKYQCVARDRGITTRWQMPAGR
jgi:hypothetical protein